MRGVMIFQSLAQALQAGYQVCDRTDSGYLVKTRTKGGWALAIVSCKSDAGRAKS